MIDVYSFLKKSVKFELVYVGDNGKQISFESEIKEVCDDKILISLPINKEVGFSVVETFAKLNAIVYTQEGVLTSNVNILKKNHGEFNDVYISFPYNNQFCQRREDTRIPMHIDFELTIDGAMYALKSKNVSGKGIACITSEPLSDFESADIIMHFPSADVNAICRKVYSKEIDLNGNISYLNGIAFIDITQENIKQIVRECLKFQLESKHNERLFETL